MERELCRNKRNTLMQKSGKKKKKKEKDQVFLVITVAVYWNSLQNVKIYL